MDAQEHPKEKLAVAAAPFINTLNMSKPRDFKPIGFPNYWFNNPDGVLIKDDLVCRVQSL